MVGGEHRHGQQLGKLLDLVMGARLVDAAAADHDRMTGLQEHLGGMGHLLLIGLRAGARDGRSGTPIESRATSPAWKRFTSPVASTIVMWSAGTRSTRTPWKTEPLRVQTVTSASPDARFCLGPQLLWAYCASTYA